jgi:hypothetical protein
MNYEKDGTYNCKPGTDHKEELKSLAIYIHSKEFINLLILLKMPIEI